MDKNLLHLYNAVVEAANLLRQADEPLDAHAHRAHAVLVAALWRLHVNLPKDDIVAMHDHDDISANVSTDDDTDVIEIPVSTARHLSDYREERGMSIPAFTRWLGIAHHEYAAVVHRAPVDRRLRDQIAYKLGVRWQEIAEFMPEEPLPQTVALPPEPGTPPPLEPWYLVDEATGQIISGPHNEPLPANAAYLFDLVTGEPLDLVALIDYFRSEEDQLPPEGYSARDRALIYGNDIDDTDVE